MVGGSFLLCATSEKGRGAWLLFTSCEGKATGMGVPTSCRAGREPLTKLTGWGPGEGLLPQQGLRKCFCF